MLNKIKQYELYILVLLFLLSILFTLGSFGYKFLTNRLNFSINKIPEDALVSELVEVVPSSVPDGTVIIDDLDTSVKKYISSEYNANLNDILVTIVQNDGTYVRGLYKTSGSEEETFLAVFRSDKWNIVYTGALENISCDVVNQNSFPVGIVSDCIDSGVLISRL